MNGLWLQDLESLEAISQDPNARTLFLRMAAMSQAGRIAPLLQEIATDEDLDEDTKGTLVELAQDEAFLFAVEDYVRSTQIVH